jgi:hypothetical protein
MVILAIIFSCLSLIILYAEMTTVFDYENNIIYNIIQATSVGPNSSFIVENVLLIHLNNLDYVSAYLGVSAGSMQYGLV